MLKQDLTLMNSNVQDLNSNYELDLTLSTGRKSNWINET